MVAGWSGLSVTRLTTLKRLAEGRVIELFGRRQNPEAFNPSRRKIHDDAPDGVAGEADACIIRSRRSIRSGSATGRRRIGFSRLVRLD